MPPRMLHDYQAQLIWGIVDALAIRQEAVLASCVSSGKTLLTLEAASSLLRERKITHAIGLVYTEVILEQFEAESGVTREGRSVAYNPIRVGYGGKVETVCKIVSPKETGWRELQTYLSGDNNEREIFVVCFPTFSSEGHWEALKAQLTRLSHQCLVIVDEGQFADLNGDTLIGERVLEVQRLGVQVLRASGTPDRTSGAAVEMYPGHRLVRHLSTHMYELYAPDRVDFRVVRVSGGNRHTTQDSGVPKNMRDTARLIAARWVEDGRPYALLRASAIKGKGETTTPAFRNALREEFSLVGCSDADFCDGTGEKRPLAFYASVRTEKALNTAGGTGRWAPASDPRWAEIPRVVFVVGRGGIGYDSPIRTHLYLVGVPDSEPFRVQLFGRVMRNRQMHPCVPEQWQRTSSVTFFIAERNANERGILRVLFNSAIYITSLNLAGALGASLNKLGHGLDGPGQPPIPLEDIAFSDEARHELGRCLADIRARWFFGAAKHDVPPTMGDELKMMQHMLQDPTCNYHEDTKNNRHGSYSETQLKKFLQISRPKCVEALVEGLEEQQQEGKPREEGFENALFEAIFTRFCNDVTLGDDLYALCVDRIHLTASEIRTVMQQEVSISLEDMLESAVRFKDSKGYWPPMTEEDPRHPGCTFGSYDDALLKLNHVGGLRQAIVDRYGNHVDHWVTIFEREQGQRAIVGRTAHAPNLYRETQPCPEVAYYPRVKVLRHLPVARYLTLLEANHMIGRYSISEISRLCEAGEVDFLSTFRASGVVQ